METPISVIDIFAGPGGLGEGFSALTSEGGKPLFKIKLSIEKDKLAHRTLELRAFFRQFDEDARPTSYYEYLMGKIRREQLFEVHPVEAAAARCEAWLAELGKTSEEEVDSRIKEALNGASNWVLIGGPPCQAYSLAGRSRIRGADESTYEKDPRHFLYKQYLRILADHQPPVFVMENVKGLLSTEVKQQKIFEQIILDLKNPLKKHRTGSSELLSYKLFSLSKRRTKADRQVEPEDFIVHSEVYGIPQARHRLIIFGIRSDIYQAQPGLLRKAMPVSVHDVIGDLPKLRSGLSREEDSVEQWRDAIKSISQAAWFSEVDADLQAAISSALSRVGLSLVQGSLYMDAYFGPKKYTKWYLDKLLPGVCNHETRRHMRQDLHRYFFAAVFAREYKRSPTLRDFPEGLLPDHNNVDQAIEGSKFNDRFRVQLRDKPSKTVVSHISKDGHYYIHYDPSQCRSLTVREAARLQTFPDNYYFEGNRTEQYHQVGNAVPPLLARKIAKIVATTLKLEIQ